MEALSLHDDLQRVWSAYKDSGDRKAREALLLAYAPLVRQVAGRVAIGLPATVDMDDLVGYGFFGLVEALERFDPAREIKFETYAASRIRGSMIDALRANDWVPRSVRQKAKELERVIAQLEGAQARPPTDAEIAAALGIGLPAYYERLSEVQSIGLASLDEAWQADRDFEGGLPLKEAVVDRTAVDPAAHAAAEEARRALAAAIDRLTERERLVISLYYYEELTLKEIGQVLSVTESRVCQIHTKAMLRLRTALGRWKESFVS